MKPKLTAAAICYCHLNPKNWEINIMHEKILETNTNPYNRLDVDPITLDIIENALRNTREQMDACLLYTSPSPRD
mgnify:CR=1 FL=1